MDEKLRQEIDEAIKRQREIYENASPLGKFIYKLEAWWVFPLGCLITTFLRIIDGILLVSISYKSAKRLLGLSGDNAIIAAIVIFFIALIVLSIVLGVGGKEFKRKGSIQLLAEIVVLMVLFGLSFLLDV